MILTIKINLAYHVCWIECLAICDSRKIAEIFFQLTPYAGMPTVNEALRVYRDVLGKRGEWPIK